MNSKVAAVAIVSLLPLVSLVAGVLAVSLVEANFDIPYQLPYAPSFPSITILSPQNATYNMSSVVSSFEVAEPRGWDEEKYYQPNGKDNFYGAINWVKVSIDGKESGNLSKVSSRTGETKLQAIISYEYKIVNLPKGTHQLTILVNSTSHYNSQPSGYYEYNKETKVVTNSITFTVDTQSVVTPSPNATPTTLPTPSPTLTLSPTSSPTQQPTVEPTQTPILLPVIEDPASFDFYIIIVVTVTAIIITLLFYSKKVKK